MSDLFVLVDFIAWIDSRDRNVEAVQALTDLFCGDVRKQAFDSGSEIDGVRQSV